MSFFFSHDFLINVLAAFFFTGVGMDVATQRVRRLPLLYVNRLLGRDCFANTYGDYICYRLDTKGTVLNYKIKITRGYGVSPKCVWENENSSAPRAVGRVIRRGENVALIFDQAGRDRIPFMIVLHTEGIAATRDFKMGYQTGALSVEPTSLYTASILLSRRKLVNPAQFLSKTQIFTHQRYTTACRDLNALSISDT